MRHPCIILLITVTANAACATDITGQFLETLPRFEQAPALRDTYYLAKEINKGNPVCGDILRMLNAPENKHFDTESASVLNVANSQPDRIDSQGVRLIEWQEWKELPREKLKEYYTSEDAIDMVTGEGKYKEYTPFRIYEATLPFSSLSGEKVPVKVINVVSSDSEFQERRHFKFKPMQAESVSGDELSGFNSRL